MRRPKQVDVLISAKDNFLMSDSVVNTIDGVKLYTGPLGLTFMGDYKDNKQRVKSYQVTANPIKVKRAGMITTTEMLDKEQRDDGNDWGLEAIKNKISSLKKHVWKGLTNLFTLVTAPEKIEQMKPLGGDCETEHLPRHQRQLSQLTSEHVEI